MPVARFKEKSKGANRKALLPGTGIGKHLITEGTSWISSRLCCRTGAVGIAQSLGCAML